MHRVTVTLEEDLSLLLQNRAKYNRRSLTQEIVFLLEAALAAESEGNLNLLRTMMFATGGLPEAPDQTS
jgi:hypothetical protein